MSNHEPGPMPGERPAGPPPAGQARPGKPPELLSRAEIMGLLDHAVQRLEAGSRRLRRQDLAEPRWPASISIVVAIVLQWLLSSKLALHPRFLLPALEGALLIGLSVANPRRIDRISAPIRAASVALILLITAANAASAGFLVKDIVTGQVGIAARNAPIALLASGAAIWGTNVI